MKDYRPIIGITMDVDIGDIQRLNLILALRINKEKNRRRKK